MNSGNKLNLILILTDDQGYGDLGCTGNPWVQTPNIDQLYGESLRLTDFHVHPICTPTRGAIMTGRYPARNGAWSTVRGRSILRSRETTMADVFAANGYRTGMFGKWHLGDNHPYRPFERGFQHAVYHKGGGIGQVPDFWGNNYFDDTYFHNGQRVEHNGYCTDIWFDEAMTFIEEDPDQPFFIYLATNAPHAPFLVSDYYRMPYEGNPDIPEPAFFGMITNIDDNIGRLRNKLAELGIADNTMLIFSTDNGTTGGCEIDEKGFVTKGYNAGMRGRKRLYYDGGHHVPCLIHCPALRLKEAHDLDDLTADIDLLPTLIGLLDLESPPLELDGLDLSGRLSGGQNEMPDRVHVLQIREKPTPPQQWQDGEFCDGNCVMTTDWRLINGRELYNIKSDPGQVNDLAGAMPDKVSQLRSAHDQWWARMGREYEEPCFIVLGEDAENPATLNSFDLDGEMAWQQAHIVEAKRASGCWHVEIQQMGRYRFSLRRWPAELAIPMSGNLTQEDAATIVYPNPNIKRVNLNIVNACLSIFDITESKPVDPDSEEALFEIDIKQRGRTTLTAQFKTDQNETRSAYYVIAERLATRR